MARFIDTPTADRCTYDVTLRDGTKAQCGRRGTKEGRCWQHVGRVAPKVIDLMAALKTSLAAAPTETTHGSRPRDDHAWMMPTGEG